MVASEGYISEGYIIGWCVYLCGVLGLMICWWRITRWIGHLQWRLFLSLVIVVMLAMPYYVGPEGIELAPALVMTLLEGIFLGSQQMQRAGIPLLITLLCTVLFTVMMQMAWYHWQRRRRARLVQQGREQVLEGERQALLQESLEGASTEH